MDRFKLNADLIYTQVNTIIGNPDELWPQNLNTHWKNLYMLINEYNSEVYGQSKDSIKSGTKDSLSVSAINKLIHKAGRVHSNINGIIRYCTNNDKYSNGTDEINRVLEELEKVDKMLNRPPNKKLQRIYNKGTRNVIRTTTKPQSKYKTRYRVKDHTQTYLFKLFLFEKKIMEYIEKCTHDNNEKSMNCDIYIQEITRLKEEIQSHNIFGNKRYINAVIVFNQAQQQVGKNAIKNTKAYKEMKKDNDIIKHSETMSALNTAITNSSNKDLHQVSYLLNPNIGDFEEYLGKGGKRKSRKYTV